MVVVGVFLLVMVLCLKGWAGRFVSRLDYRLLLGIGVSFCGVVVFLNVSGSFDYFASLLGKSGTANTRAIIWREALSWFVGSPVTGVGYEPDIVTTLRIGINHCHNVLLQLLYTGGGVTAAFFAAFAWLCRPKGKPEVSAVPLLIYVPLIFVGWSFDFYLYMSVAVAPFILLARCCDCGADAA